MRATPILDGTFPWKTDDITAEYGDGEVVEKPKLQQSQDGSFRWVDGIDHKATRDANAHAMVRDVLAIIPDQAVCEAVNVIDDVAKVNEHVGWFAAILAAPIALVMRLAFGLVKDAIEIVTMPLSLVKDFIDTLRHTNKE